MTPIISPDEEKMLLALARASIQYGLKYGGPLEIELANHPLRLTETGAAFVTLEKRGELRGCIGSVKAHRPLVADVAEHAWNAAFRDPRFPPLTELEYDQLSIEISILTQPEEMSFTSEKDLLAQIQPGRDGLIFEDGYRRGLFLPAVWEKIPDVTEFFHHLKQKAGLPVDHWSNSVRVQRFFSHEFSEDDPSTP